MLRWAVWVAGWMDLRGSAVSSGEGAGFDMRGGWAGMVDFAGLG